MGPRANRESSADNVRTMLASWHEWEVRDGERRIILCVATPLELRPGFPGFDPIQLESLIRDATDMMRTSASPIDAIRIVPREELRLRLSSVQMEDMIATGRVSWFDNRKQFGFVKLDDRLGDAFLHMDVLKVDGYYFVPRGTSVQVRVEPDRSKCRVVEILNVDTSTAQHGEPPPLVRKPKGA